MVAERQHILGQALDARTLAEIEIATRDLREWIRCNPTDTGITEAFEGLSLMRDIAEDQEAERIMVMRGPARVEQVA